MPAADPKPTPSRRGAWWWFVALALAIAFNVWGVSRLAVPEPRVTIPYSPAFLGQVRAGNVVSISAKGSSAQGQLKHAIRYPPSDAGAKATHRFATTS
jgi:hypothetical protein